MSAHTTFSTQWIKNRFFWKLKVTRGPSQHRSSQLLSGSCGPLITVQRSRRAAQKMLIYQDVERWGLHRWEQESRDQSEANWDGGLNTCVADYSHNPTFLVQRTSKCRHGTHSLQRKRVYFHLRVSDLYQHLLSILKGNFIYSHVAPDCYIVIFAQASYMLGNTNLMPYVYFFGCPTPFMYNYFLKTTLLDETSGYNCVLLE